MKLRLHTTWLPAPGVIDPAEAATWCALEIAADSTSLTAVWDERTQAKRDCVYGSALPLAEWLAESWPRIAHERRFPPRNYPGWHEWVGFHALRAARDGGAMPDLRIRRVGDADVLVSASPDRGALAPGISVRFLAELELRLAAREVSAELARFVEAVLERVKPLGGDRAARLETRWATVLTDRTVAAAGRLGADDETLDPDSRRALEQLLADQQCDMLLTLAEGSASDNVSQRIADARVLLAFAPSLEPATPRWEKLVAELKKPAGGRPWLTGWQAASILRNVVKVPEKSFPGSHLGTWVEQHCGWPASSQLYPLEKQAGAIDTIHVCSTGRTPAVATAARRAEARRFRLARCLYYSLFAYGGRTDLAIPDSQLLPELSEANAFAAELLAPVARLREMIPASGVWTHEELSGAVSKLEVSPYVIFHQINNRDLGVCGEFPGLT